MILKKAVESIASANGTESSRVFVDFFRMIRIVDKLWLMAKGYRRGTHKNAFFFLSKCHFLLLCLTPLCFALPTDKNEILTFRANFADINQETHLGTYKDKVELDQGSTHLRAAKARTEVDAKNKLIKAIAEGSNKKQAHFWTTIDEKKPPVHAYANIIRYFPEKHFIQLIGRARVEQGKDSFSAPTINYDTLHQHVMSQSGSQGQTVIIIHPEDHHE